MDFYPIINQPNPYPNKILVLSSMEVGKSIQLLPNFSKIKYYSYMSSRKDEKIAVNHRQQIRQLSDLRPKKLPLLFKRMNPVEKYINTYRQKSNISQQTSPVNPPQKLSASSHNELLERKLTPEPNISEPVSFKCCVKYEPLNERKREERLQLLEKIQQKYSILKQSVKGDKQPFMSKFTLPLNTLGLHKKEKNIKIEQSIHQIQKQFKQEIMIQDGQKYFVDLYMMKKDRNHLKQSMKKNRQIIEITINQQRKQYEKFLRQKKIKEAEERKNKMLKYKGLHWNVYYQMLALSKNQKERLKQCNSSFVSTYGTN